MSDRVNRRRARIRERTSTEAMRLFAGRGLDTVTITDTTETADIGRGILFTHFPNKCGILRYLGEQAVQIILDADMGDGAAEERLRRMLDATAGWLEAHPEPVRQMVRARSFNLSPDFSSENQKHLNAAIADILATGRSSGELRGDVPLGVIAPVVRCGYYVYVMAWATRPDGETLRGRLATSLDTTLSGLK